MTVGMTATSRTSLPAIKLVQSSRMARRLANVVLALLLICIVAMFYVPWQQSAKGTGKVVAYVPQERQQTVTSPVKGVVVRSCRRAARGDACAPGRFHTGD